MNQESNQLGVLLVSAARHQGKFAEIFTNHPDARLIAVTDDPNCERWVLDANQELADTWRIPYIPDLADALQLPDVDIASICSIYRRHGTQTLQALHAGKHVLLDKQPLAMTVQEGRALASVARRAESRGIKLTYMHHSLDAAVLDAADVIRKGEIGDPLSVYVQTIANYGPGDDPDVDPLGRFGRGFHPRWWDGGELMHHGAYAISCSRRLMNSDIASVYAVSGSHFNTIYRETGADDLNSVSVSFANSGVGTIVVGRAPNPASVAKLDHFVHVVGTKGIVTADWEEPTFLLMASGSGFPSRQRVGLRADDLVINQFLDAITNGKEPVLGIGDGLPELEAHLAAMESARCGKPVEVPMTN